VVSSNPRDRSRLEERPSKITVYFSQDVIHDGSSNAANNLINYLLVKDGKNNKFETASCQIGRSGDDVAVNFSRVVYKNTNEDGHRSFMSTLTLKSRLSSGQYRLFVCGSTSIENLAGVKLNNGTDTIISFSVAKTDD
jgi:methionine-rich copper-binding protein CopC